MKIKAFKLKPYTVTSESGKQFTCDEIIVGIVRKDGSFSGAIFDDDDDFFGEVIYSKEELKSKIEYELALIPAEAKNA